MNLTTDVSAEKFFLRRRTPQPGGYATSIDVPGSPEQIDFGKLRRQLAEGVLLDDVYVSRGDRATGIDIVAEIGARDRPERLRLT